VSTEEEFRSFVNWRWAALVRFGWALTGDRGQAEDLVQTALERTWRHWPRVEFDAAEAYVRAAMTNLAISQWRRRRLREFSRDIWTPAEEQPAPSRPPQADGAQETHAVHDVVWRELQALPARMRAVVVLRFLCDYSEAQTAAALGCSPGTVKSQTARAMSRLRERAALQELVGGMTQPEGGQR
jgi:RNA polymerase sigma-70 factor (sigma-E family)